VTGLGGVITGGLFISNRVTDTASEGGALFATFLTRITGTRFLSNSAIT